jgi:predicted DNA-binding transcriptional regulator YafY
MHQLPTVNHGSNGSVVELDSRPTSPRLPLARLLQLLLILQSERFPNATRLAEACGVSRRTIYRDLTILEAAGITVLYQPDRQGYRLARECLLQPPQLDDMEALALLIMSRLGFAQDPFGLLPHARTGLAKVLQALPVPLRGRVTSCGELIPDERSNLEFPPERQAIYETILSALSQRRRLRITYRDDMQSEAVTTLLSLYRLARIRCEWSLVGRSSLHREVEIFRVPWIERIELTDQPYSIPPRFRLGRFLEKSRRGHSAPRHDVLLRFSPRVAPAIRDAPYPKDQTLTPSPSGELDLFLSVETLDDIVFWALGFGDQVEVVSPEELRLAIREQAERVASIHSRRAD